MSHMTLDELVAYSHETTHMIDDLERRFHHTCATIDAVAVALGMQPSVRGIASWKGKAGEFHRKTATGVTA